MMKERLILTHFQSKYNSKKNIYISCINSFIVGKLKIIIIIDIIFKFLFTILFTF